MEPEIYESEYGTIAEVYSDMKHKGVNLRRACEVCEINYNRLYNQIGTGRLNLSDDELKRLNDWLWQRGVMLIEEGDDE